MRAIGIIIAVAVCAITAQAGPIDIVRLKYGGGGDWYNDPDEETNLLREFGIRTGASVDTAKHSLAAGDDELFAHPFLFVTGHGEIRFTEREVERLRLFLLAGGFIYADDDYGMDPSFRREIARVLPAGRMVELSLDHPIYTSFYDLGAGIPKIHEHEKGSPQILGMYRENRLVVVYTYNTNISDGWTAVHNDPPEKREQAFRMGVNILWFALTNP